MILPWLIINYWPSSTMTNQYQPLSAHDEFAHSQALRNSQLRLHRASATSWCPLAQVSHAGAEHNDRPWCRPPAGFIWEIQCHSARVTHMVFSCARWLCLLVRNVGNGEPWITLKNHIRPFREKGPLSASRSMPEPSRHFQSELELFSPHD